MRSHDIDYEIRGDDLQFVEVYLDPEETAVAEAGTMIFMDEGVTFEAKMGDGSEPEGGGGFFRKAKSAAGRVLSGESLFMTHFTNSGGGRAKVAFGASVPGKIVPLDLAEIGRPVICQRDAFLCAALGTKVSMHFNRRFGSGLFGGEGTIAGTLLGVIFLAVVHNALNLLGVSPFLQQFAIGSLLLFSAAADIIAPLVAQRRFSLAAIGQLRRSQSS